MTGGFYGKLALTNMKKNRKTYVPYLLTCIGTVMMFYIILSLGVNSALDAMGGGATMKLVLLLGAIIVGFFAVLFLFYTNSFLVKRRKKEFGLYYILGMEKRHIGRMMFWETLYTALISLVLGIGLGILFSKLVFLALLKLMNLQAVIGVEVSAFAVSVTAELFGFIFLMTLLNSIRLVYTVRPVELLKGGQMGEKMPRTRWIMAIVGVVTLAAGYIMAVRANDPMIGILHFFWAAILVIIGTFCLFTAGSIAFLKLLKKNKKYYYKTDHFISVSGMIYRMKQNAASLANICVMSTGVLLLISSTTCLYIGQEDALYSRYPREFIISANADAGSRSNEEYEMLLRESRDVVQEYLETKKITPRNERAYLSLEMTAVETEGGLTFFRKGASDIESYRVVECMLLSDYNRENQSEETLADGEVLLFTEEGNRTGDTFAIDGRTWKLKKAAVPMTFRDGFWQMYTTPVYILVVKDFADMQKLCAMETEAYGEIMASKMELIYTFDVDMRQEDILRLDTALEAYLNGEAERTSEYAFHIQCRSVQRTKFYGMYGGLFFLGIFLGLLFVMATVLIIYYKQISEGYEDKERFVVMQKIGMDREEIRRSIQSQVLTVFFLPLFAAGVHGCFAFHIMEVILTGGFGLTNIRLFVVCALATFVVFSLFYAAVYLITAKEYYKIVSE